MLGASWETFVILASLVLVANHLGQPASDAASSDLRDLPVGPRDRELWSAAATQPPQKGGPYDRILVCADLHGDLEQTKAALHMIGATDKVMFVAMALRSTLSSLRRTAPS